MDGDEMNIHLAQSVQARNELARIASVRYNIIGVKHSAPIIACKHDDVIGSYLLSKYGEVSYGMACNMLSRLYTSKKYSIQKTNKLISGNELFSYIIPDGINIVEKNDFGKFIVKNGVIKEGVLNKSFVSMTPKSIVNYIWDKLGGNKTNDFINDAHRLTIDFLNYYGSTIGFGDCYVDKEMEIKIDNFVQTKIMEMNKYITEMEDDTNDVSLETIENSIKGKLQIINSETEGILKKYLTDDNNLYKFMVSGSKGKISNLSQMMGSLGQIVLDGIRFKKSVNNRSLVCFHEHDDTPEARGFIKNNFFKGLNGTEFFFHTATAREGMINTAIKSVTWETNIIVLDNNKPKYIEIGRFIDNYLDINKEKIKHYTDRNMELLETKNIYIPTTDDKGNVSWGEITALTRHDPGKQLYKIKTYGGREVIVTESKSLIVWNNKLNGFFEKPTPEIIVGDYLPVNETIPEPPIILNEINMIKYLSKKEYIYGTDFNKAVELMNKDMNDRNKIKQGWWKLNNNNIFTLPYTKKSSLQRALIRSNTSVIKNNNIYCYRGKRNNCYISDKFELNYINGIFIGLYLADGCSNKYTVRITNINKNIQNFIKTWFNNNNIKYVIEDKINKIGGRSYTIEGSSVVFADFIKKFVGNRAENKFIPDDILCANVDFIKGLINGYISGDGSVSRNFIYASSASEKLITGVSYLLSRLGIFSKLSKNQLKKNNLNTKKIKPSYKLSVTSKWGKKFSEEIELIDNTKQDKLNNCVWTNKHRNFDQINNVVKDKIIEISLVDVKEHPKVYDLTIPSTLNFGLANGLQVRDTGKTGYIQRRMVKALEDVKVCYDGTVRNVNNVIIQNYYGCNSIDLMKQNEIKLPFVAYSDDKLREKLVLSRDEIKELEKKMKIKNLSKLNEDYYDKLIHMRDYLRKVYVRSTMDYKTLQETYKSPVNLYRLSNEYNNDKMSFDLHPEYIINKLDELITKDSLKLNIYDNKMFAKDNENIKMIFKIGLYNYLSPKECIYNHKYSKKDFDNLINEIEQTYIKNIVNPGEMVGIITAQSLGEPVSQMNMNSKHSAGKGGGVSTGLNGYPRFEELINHTKDNKAPMMYVYFDDKINENKTLVNEINSTFKYLIIDDIIDKVEVLYHLSDGSKIDQKLKKDNVGNPQNYPYNETIDENMLNFVFRFKFNIEKMLDRDITVMDIKIKLFKFIYDYNNNSKNSKLKKSDKYIMDNLSKVIISNNNNIMHFRFNMNNFNMNLINDLLIILLNEVTLKGLTGINNSAIDDFNSVYFDKDTHEKKEKKEYYVVTEGINYMELLQMKNIDHTRTFFNNIHQIHKLYGLEAARNILLFEMNKVFTETGNDVNPNHFSVLCDFMIHSGSFTSIRDSGLSKLKLDPLTRASFEKATTHLENSAVYNEVDSMKSVSSRIMTGQVFRGGTGMFKLQLNTDLIKNSELVLDKSINQDDIQLVKTDELIVDILKYGINNTDFFMP